HVPRRESCGKPIRRLLADGQNRRLRRRSRLWWDHQPDSPPGHGHRGLPTDDHRRPHARRRRQAPYLDDVPRPAMKRRLIALATDQRGVALPMALLTLAILSGLVLAFSTLSASEPTIASNQLMVAQARSLAEGGVELALWALMNPADVKGIPVTGPVPAPYDGSRPIAGSAGGAHVGSVRISVTSGPGGCAAGCAWAAERCIVATGWAPDEAARGPKAHQKIAVTAGNPQRLFRNPPAPVIAHGDLQVSGTSLVESRADTSCGRKAGVIA